MIIFCFCPKECNKLHWWAKQNKIFILGIRNPLCRLRGVKGLIKNFELRIDSMECARPAVVKG